MSFDLKIRSGDLQIVNGAVSTVVNEEKLQQDLLKIILTPLGGNRLNPWYGSLLTRHLIGYVIDTNIFITTAQSQMNQAIDTLRQLQVKQNETYQKLSPEEQIAAISRINIAPNQNDPRIMDVVVDILSRSYRIVRTTFDINLV